MPRAVNPPDMSSPNAERRRDVVPNRRRLLAVFLGAIMATGISTRVSLAESADAGARTLRGGISGPDALSRAKQGQVTIIDVRSPEEWKQTGLPLGAHAVTIHDPEGIDGFVRALTRSFGGRLDTPVALICATGRRSTRARIALVKAGFTQVLNIDEGMLGSANGPGWLARSLPVEPCKRC